MGHIAMSSVTSLTFKLQVIFEQRERVFHRDIQTRENNVWKQEAQGRVFLLIVFECLDIRVGHELELFK